jgi:hypothetical protein
MSDSSNADVPTSREPEGLGQESAAHEHGIPKLAGQKTESPPAEIPEPERLGVG